jgi:hypothetical protein
MTDTTELSGIAATVAPVARALHSGESFVVAANVFARITGARRVTNQVDAIDVLQELLQWLLDANRYDMAAQLLWSPTQFCADAQSVQTIWKEVQSHQMTLLMGASSMGKSYTPGVLCLLEWLRDPEWTAIRCVGPTEDHLITNLFSHLTSLHANASFPLPGVARDLFLGLDQKRREGGLLGVVIPQGSSKARGRLQGSKRRPRPSPHPEFGPLSRLILLIDELENVPPAVYPDIENLVSNIQSESDRGFKLIASWNPKDRTLKPFDMAEPHKGWNLVDIDSDFVWTSRRGYRVVRLDAAQSENVRTGKVVFPGLQTKAGFDKVTEVAGGVGSSGWYTFARGMYPPTGGTKNLLNSDQLNARLGVPVWLNAPEYAAGVDLALTGGARAPFTRVQYGIATAIRTRAGTVVPFVDSAGLTVPRPLIYVEYKEDVESGDTIRVATNVRAVAEKNRVPPGHLVVDRTGNGAGVHDLLKGLWSPDVIGVNYTYRASERKILAEDRTTPYEEYRRIDCELWFALQKLVVHGFVWFNPDLAHREELFSQITGRQYDPQRQSKVESKSEYTARGFTSPDDADSLTLSIDGVRRVSGLTFSFSGTSVSGDTGTAEMLSKAGSANALEAVEPDPTNLVEYLEDGIE